ncbi:hypothetical protein IG631_14151 [Alternaria alternata]|nr:hypothetical protein IG631_14151 [Alternaria alternata]
MLTTNLLLTIHGRYPERWRPRRPRTYARDSQARCSTANSPSYLPDYSATTYSLGVTDFSILAVLVAPNDRCGEWLGTCNNAISQR